MKSNIGEYSEKCKGVGKRDVLVDYPTRQAYIGAEAVAVYTGAVEQARALKPSIPLSGINGIPMREEIELEMTLTHAEGN
jgi:hypothetical protein